MSLKSYMVMQIIPQVEDGYIEPRIRNTMKMYLYSLEGCRIHWSLSFVFHRFSLCIQWNWPGETNEFMYCQKYTNYIILLDRLWELPVFIRPTKFTARTIQVLLYLWLVVFWKLIFILQVTMEEVVTQRSILAIQLDYTSWSQSYIVLSVF